MHRLLAGAAAVALLAAPAVATADVRRYVAVDAVEVAHLQIFSSSAMFIFVAGRDESGAEASRGFYLPTHSSSPSTPPTGYTVEACQRMALMALAKPGRYDLEVTYSVQTERADLLQRCRLIRND